MAKEIVQHQALVLEQRGELLTTSVIIANQLGAKHSDFLPVINKYLDTDFSRCAEQRIVKDRVIAFAELIGRTPVPNILPTTTQRLP